VRSWIAALFIVGSTLFAVGALPYYAEGVGLEATAATSFVGSLFFTAAALLQYREAAGGYLVWAPHDAGWLACAVQLAGTLWFNWSTGNALRHNLAAAIADERVWRPDALGSIAFGASAVGAYIVPTSDDVWRAELANLGTFIGALCFLAGAVMLLPSRAPAV
jgi:hypothetical protein